MMKPELRDILLPTDFSAGATAALPYAVALATGLGARLHLLHVITPDGGDPDLARRGFGELEQLLAMGGARPVDTVHATRRARLPREAILDYVVDKGIGLVVMATHGRWDLGRLFFGSVAEGVLRHGRCPVWLVKRGVRSCLTSDGLALGLDRIMLPTDLSENSVRALAWAQLVGGEATEISLLNVVEPGIHPALLSGEVSSIFELDSELEHRLRQRVEALFGPPEPGRLQLRLDEGNAARRIALRAKEQEIDLIVMANNGYDEIEDYLLGSTTERVLRLAQRPVLVV